MENDVLTFLNWIQDNDFGSRRLAQFVNEFVDFGFDLLFRQIASNLRAYLFQGRNDLAAVSQASVPLVIAVLDFSIGYDGKGAKTKIEVLLDHDAVAQNQIELLARQSDASHPFLESRSGSECLRKFVAFLDHFGIARCIRVRRIGTGKLARLLQNQQLIFNQAQGAVKLHSTWPLREWRVRFERELPDKIRISDEIRCGARPISDAGDHFVGGCLRAGPGRQDADGRQQEKNPN